MKRVGIGDMSPSERKCSFRFLCVIDVRNAKIITQDARRRVNIITGTSSVYRPNGIEWRDIAVTHGCAVIVRFK